MSSWVSFKYSLHPKSLMSQHRNEPLLKSHLTRFQWPQELLPIPSVLYLFHTKGCNALNKLRFHNYGDVMANIRFTPCFLVLHPSTLLLTPHTGIKHRLIANWTFTLLKQKSWTYRQLKYFWIFGHLNGWPDESSDRTVYKTIVRKCYCSGFSHNI